MLDYPGELNVITQILNSRRWKQKSPLESSDRRKRVGISSRIRTHSTLLVFEN